MLKYNYSDIFEGTIAMMQRLKLIRKSLHLTQAEFSVYLGITQTAYSMIENGHRPLSPRYIKIICTEFGVSEQWLTCGEGEMFSISPHEQELSQLFHHMTPDSQRFLLHMARELLQVQQRLTEKKKNSPYYIALLPFSP